MPDPSPATAPAAEGPELAAVLSSLSAIAEQGDALARAQQLVRLSVGLAHADVACLVVHGEGGAVVRTLYSTDEPGALQRVHAVVARQERARTAEPAVRRIPLAMSAGPSGALYLVGGSPTTDLAGDAIVDQFVTLAAQLVENAVRYEESRQEAEWRKALGEINQVLLSSTGDDETLVWQHIADHVQRLTRTRTVTICTPCEDEPARLQVRVAAGVGHDQLPGRRFGVASSLSALVISTGRSQAGTADQWAVSHIVAEPRVPLGPLLAIPLVAAGSPRGAIVLSREAGQLPYSARDVTLTQDFASQATLAIELAETRASQVALQSRTDLERVPDSFQDQLIQRLYALGLTLDLAVRDDPQAWLERARAEIADAIDEARSSLRLGHGPDAGGRRV